MEVFGLDVLVMHNSGCKKACVRLLVRVSFFPIPCYLESVAPLASQQHVGKSAGQNLFPSRIITYISPVHIGLKKLMVPIEYLVLLQSMNATRNLHSFNKYP